MKLLQDLGLLQLEGLDNEAIREALEAEAWRIVRSGIVRYSPDEWFALENVERDALASAGDRLRAEHAALSGACVLGGEEAQAQVYSVVDGGAWLDRVRLAEAVEAVAAALTSDLARKRAQAKPLGDVS
jgi:hypothetical protein